METTSNPHDNHPHYTEVRSNGFGTITDSRTVCEDGAIIHDWRHEPDPQATHPHNDYCYDVARLVCHECDKPLNGERHTVRVSFHDYDGPHDDAVCFTHEACAPATA